MATETITGNVVTMSEVFKDASDRGKTETPPFFARIKGWAKVALKICGSVAIVGVGVLGTCATFGVSLPVSITIAVGILTGLGSLGATLSVGVVKTANMATSNKEILNRPSNEVVVK